MAITYNAVNFFTGDGETKVFAFSFPYLSKDHVKVTQAGTALVQGTDFSITDEQVTLVSAPATSAAIKIYRETPTSRVITWSDGNYLLASNMTVDQLQTLYILQEQQDLAKLNNIADNGDGYFYAVNKQIKNVADPTADQDVVTKKYMETVSDGFVAENTTIQNDIKSRQTDIITRQADVTAKQSSVATMKTSVEASQADVTTKQSNVATMKTSVEASQADVITKQSNVATMKASVEASQADVTAKQSNVATMESNVEAIQIDVKARQSDVSNMQTATKTSETNAAQSEADALAYKKACEALQVYFNVPTQLFAGSIIAWGSNTIPYGYLLCDGSAISRTTYSELFAQIGTTFGSGDGSTTFNVPDLRNKTIVGKGTSFATLGGTGGETTHILTEDEIPPHKHLVNGTTSNAGGHTHSVYAANAQVTPRQEGITTGNNTKGPNEIAYTTSSAGDHSHSFSVTSENTGGGKAHNNMPPYNTVNFIIKYTAVGQSTADSLYRQNSTNYSVGDVLIGAINLPKNLELVCSASGTTGAANITSWGAAGATQDDGSVKWTIRYKAGGNVSGTAPIVTSTDAQGNVTVTHSDSGVTAGDYNKVTVDAKGHVTAATAENTLAGVGITNAYTKDEVDTLLSITGPYDLSDWNKIKALVKAGLAEKVIPVGSQIIVKWTDNATSTAYSVPLDVVHYGQVTLQDGEIVPGMFLQWHYATPFGVQFDNYEAFYYATAALPAGTYNVTFGNSWGTNAVSGKTYQFTLTQAVPIGGQLSGFEGLPDVAPTNWKVKSWASKTATTATETVSVTEGNGGTNLGTLKFGGDGTLNCMQRVGYGYNRWSASAIRQWLNSRGAANAWWTPQHNWDRYPNELLTKQGFLTGFDDAFIAALTPIKVTTALNTLTDASVGTTEDTYDKIFLPSLQQEYITPQLADVEGESWKYWKRASGRTSYAPLSTSMAEYITYGIASKTSAQSVRLRSANRGTATYTWSVGAPGNVYVYSSYPALCCAPACVIC